jgi:hypothetical protein
MLLSTSCSDFLEQEPGSQTSTEELFSTYDGFLEALNGAYYMLEDLHAGERNTVYADVVGGNLTFSPGLSGSSEYLIESPLNIENVYTFDDDADESDLELLYDACYDVINSVNSILEYIDSFEDITEDERNQIKAESLSIRALTHFILVRIYGQNYTYTDDASHLGVIYNTSTLEIGVDYPSRETVAVCYQNIINDFEEALTLFTGENSMQGDDYSYFSEYSVKALLSRVALYANEWQTAIDYASEVILNSGIELMSQEEYAAQWELSSTPNSETIFEFAIPVSDDGYGSTISAFFGYTDEEDYEDYVASDDLLSLYDDGDIRVDSMYIEAYLPTISGNDTLDLPYYFTKKFQDNPGSPLIRMSEIYLNRAEAYAQLNELENAVTDLNTIRDRAGAITAEVTDDVLEEIFLERRRELCFEGHLLFDLARFHYDIEREAGCVANTCDLNYPSNHYVLPIPEDNVELNSNLVQNEGY